MSVATAYITDISAEETRARRFGLLNAMFGIGFIIGPVLGGALGDPWLRLPFIAAAALNAGDLFLAFFMLPESRMPSGQKMDLAAFNPLVPLRWVFSMKRLLPITFTFFVFSASGEAYGICWALWGSDT